MTSCGAETWAGAGAPPPRPQNSGRRGTPSRALGARLETPRFGRGPRAGCRQGWLTAKPSVSCTGPTVRVTGRRAGSGTVPALVQAGPSDWVWHRAQYTGDTDAGSDSEAGCDLESDGNSQLRQGTRKRVPQEDENEVAAAVETRKEGRGANLSGETTHGFNLGTRGHREARARIRSKNRFPYVSCTWDGGRAAGSARPN